MLATSPSLLADNYYNLGMHIVLPGALPDAQAAKALIPHLQQAAPVFFGWLTAARASLQHIDRHDSGCTSYEAWQLQRAGFKADPSQNLSAGLGPLWVKSPVDPDKPVWLLELVHMEPTQSSTALLGADQLSIEPQHSAALFDTVQPLFEQTGFSLHADTDIRWRLQTPADFTLSCASTALVAATSVNDWWPQDEIARPWRRLFNEIQMLWHEHPVNLARQRQGLTSINGLWLFGGGRPNQLPAQPPLPTQSFETLYAPFMAQDWGGWLAALSALEAQVFEPLSAQNTIPTLTLLGNSDIATLRSRPMAGWLNWLPGQRNTWRKWWSDRP